MGLRERIGGEWWWILNMVVHGVGNVLLSLLECLEWGYGRILGKDGKNFRVLPDLRLEIDPGLALAMISGVGMWF
jgi:hypothetical protein